MKKKIIAVAFVLVSVMLLIPIPLRLKDGGTVKYQAILYSVSDVHRLASSENDVTLETGIIVELFGLEVFNNVAKATEKLSSGEADNQINEVQPGGTSAEDAFDIAVSYANWAELNEVYAKALNTEKMAISSVRHLPIFKLDTSEDLEQFKSDFGDTLTMEYGYDEVPSFNEVTAKYDEEFFKENTIMLVFVEASSGSCRFGVNSVYCDGNSFCVHVEQTIPKFIRMIWRGGLLPLQFRIV